MLLPLHECRSVDGQPEGLFDELDARFASGGTWSVEVWWADDDDEAFAGSVMEDEVGLTTSLGCCSRYS